VHSTETVKRGWTFLSNHMHVLVCVARSPAVRVRDIAVSVGITERAASRILGELESDGYLTRVRSGRSNRYEIHPDQPLRHPLEARHSIGELLRIMTSEISITGLS
jgi:predicted transcriptional regulator of viral defense system